MARPGKSRAQKPDKVGSFVRQGLSCKTKRLSWRPFPFLSFPFSFPFPIPNSLPPSPHICHFPHKQQHCVSLSTQKRLLGSSPFSLTRDFRIAKGSLAKGTVLFPSLSLGGCGRPPGWCQRGGKTAADWREKGTGPAGNAWGVQSGHTRSGRGGEGHTGGHTHTHTHSRTLRLR